MQLGPDPDDCLVMGRWMLPATDTDDSPAHGSRVQLGLYLGGGIGYG